MGERKPTVSIVVPAYNEAANIEALLTSLLSQNRDSFTLTEIVVVSDGSTDATVACAKRVQSQNIRVVDDGRRVGKLQRLNELFESVTSDILVQFDADIKLSNSMVVGELVKPFLEDAQTALVCGNHKPFPPQGFIERAAVFGVRAWDDAVDMLGERGGRYRCSGQIRAFSKQFLKKFRFPLEIGSGEDTYNFYYAKRHHLKVVFARKALVYHRLPTTLGDYTRQMSRYMYAKNQMQQYFTKEECAEYETMTTSIKLRALLKNAVRSSPLTVAGFLLLHLAPRIAVLTYEHKQIWDTATSSKQL